MRCKSIIFLSALVMTSSEAKAVESFKLKNGQTVYGYREGDKDLPAKFLKDECGKYIFTDKKFTPLKDGKYAVQEDINIMVDHSCLFIQKGEAKLINNQKIEFYQTNWLNPGDAVYSQGKNRYQRIYNKKIKLDNSEEFNIIDGHIENYGTFDENSNDAEKKIIYESKDWLAFKYEYKAIYIYIDGLANKQICQD